MGNTLTENYLLFLHFDIQHQKFARVYFFGNKSLHLLSTQVEPSHLGLALVVCRKLHSFRQHSLYYSVQTNKERFTHSGQTEVIKIAANSENSTGADSERNSLNNKMNTSQNTLNYLNVFKVKHWLSQSYKL